MAFTNVSSFRVQLVDDYGDADRVTVKIGLESGLKILDASSNRTLRSLELSHITRWQSFGRNLVLYTRTPVDVEERQLTLEGDETTIRNVLDTLTCSCMQLAELLQSKQSESAREAAGNLSALAKGGSRKKTSTKTRTADEVDYWRNPDKAGWMQSQGEHLKSWRKRWFVLKSGFLFRFMNATVSESVKPRGVVDLSTIQDIKHNTSLTNKPNTIQLKTSSGGSVCYITDTETELVEWISALEGAVSAIAKRAAGLDEPRAGGSGARKSGSTQPSASEWMKQLESTMESFEKATVRDGAGRRDRDRTRDRGGRNNAALVNVVGYESTGGGGSSGAGGGSSGLYGQIAGAQVLSDDTMLNYGGGGGRDGAGATHSASAAYDGAPDAYASQRAPAYGHPMAHYGAPPTGGGGGYEAPTVASYPPPEVAPHTQYAPAFQAQQASAPAQQQPQYAAAPQAPEWNVHYAPDGRPYYHNPATGATTWELPGA